MRKQQAQPALAPLTHEDKEQLAEWLRRDGYDVVLERIRKPRPEGFELNISKKPLQTFYAKVLLLDSINARAAADKKLTLSEFETIASGDRLLSSASSEKKSILDTRNGELVSDDVHGVIMEATYDLATSGDNTAAQLLSLQRLADFPARAEYRAHKVEMDFHRKYIAGERLELSKQSLELRKQQLALRAAEKSEIRNGQSGSDPQSEMSDNLGRLARTLNDVEDRATKMFNLPPIDRSSPEPSDTLATVGIMASAASTSTPSQISSPVVPEPQPPHGVPPLGGHPIPLTPAIHPGEPTEPNGPTVSTVSPSPDNPLIHQSTNPPIQSPSLEDRVNAYNVARYQEAMIGKDKNIVGRNAARFFKSKLQTCPCGHQLPCPDHGDFPKFFWELSPNSADYKDILRVKGLPFTAPHLLIAEQEKRARLAALPPLDPVALAASSKAHAIKRWRCHTPRPRGVPFPDESWHEECPCGAKRPCAHHEDLWLRLRYLKPWTEEYIGYLKEHNIPVYTPSDAEIKFWERPADPAVGISAGAASTPSQTSSPIAPEPPSPHGVPPLGGHPIPLTPAIHPGEPSALNRTTVSTVPPLPAPSSTLRAPGLEPSVVPDDPNRDYLREYLASLTEEEKFIRYYGD